jgi:mannose-6-phosphate isomerase class I
LFWNIDSKIFQAHPDKALAARLHASNPKEYRDTNHKPEMAISLTDFEAMYVPAASSASEACHLFRVNTHFKILATRFPSWREFLHVNVAHHLHMCILDM